MTDNDIIKALECYIKENEFEYFHSNTMNEYPLIKKALNLINRQKAEIEALIAGQETLQKENEETQEKLEALLCEATGGKLSKHSYTAEVMTTQAHEHLLKCCEDERAEAVKEFAESVKIKTLAMVHSPGILTTVDYIKCIDDIVKEWVGDNND